jgi:peptide/nickel transport system substrate-binding protein
MSRRRRLAGCALVLGCIAGSAFAAEKSDLVLALQGEAEKGYDPLLGWGEYGHPLFQSTLLRRDADLRPQADLATSWRLSEDRLTWTVQIRTDAKFSDGSELSAEDVAFTFEKASKAGGLADLAVIESAKATDRSTVVLTLKEPRITFAENFFSLGIVPARSYGADYARKPVGSGPYRLVQWDKGQQLIVEANPHYYGKKPAFKKLTFLFTSEDTSFVAARAGKVDLVAVPPGLADKVPNGMKRVVARSVDNRGLMFPMVPRTGKTAPNGAPIGNDITADPAIRHAINAAIDRNSLVRNVLLGHGTPAYGPADGLPWSNPEAKAPGGGIEAAKKILDEAGWKPGRDGVRAKDGKEARIPVVYFAGDSTRQALALAAADMVRPLGIVLDPAGKSRDETARLRHSSIVLYGWGSHNPLEVHNLYNPALSGIGSYNTGYYSNPKVANHFEAAQKAGSLEEAYFHWQQAEWDGETGFGMRGDAAWAWLVNLDHIYFVNSCLDLGKLQIEPHGHGWPVTAGIADWTWTCS